MVPTVQSLGIDRLPVAERIRLVEEIWETIADEPDSVDVPDWHLEIIDERLAELESNPTAGIPWGDVKARILEKLSRKPA